MTYTLHSAIKEQIQAVLDSGQRVTAMAIAKQVQENEPDLIARESPSLILKYIADEAKRIIRRFDTTDEQEALFDLPSAISIQDAEGNQILVPTRRATWADLEKGLGERQRNIHYAERKRARMQRAMDRLRAIMQTNPEMTVEDAMRELGRDNA